MDPEQFETSTSTSGGEQEVPAIGMKPKSTSSTSSVKKSGGRRSVQKRVVSVPIADVDASRSKGAGEGAPPSDSWAWRKYGQKPIKGSPYPRGYYRCSSSKGCPARKQVERSRIDPSMLVVTYAAEHNHPWPLPKNHHHHHHHSHNSHTPAPPPPPAAIEPEEEEQEEEQEEGSPAPAATAANNSGSPAPEETATFSTKLCDDEDSPMMLMAADNEFCWHPYMSEASLPSVTMMLPFTYDDDDAKEPPSAAGNGGGGGEEEDSLFAGLGELPECSMVFRRGFSIGAA